MAGSNLEKRIATLEAKANSRGARWIVIEVDGDLPDEEAAVETLLEPLCVGRHDTVVARYQRLAASCQHHASVIPKRKPSTFSITA